MNCSPRVVEQAGKCCRQPGGRRACVQACRVQAAWSTGIDCATALGDVTHIQLHVYSVHP